MPLEGRVHARRQAHFASRYLIACEALATTKEAYAITVFERAFKEFGLPKAIRTDNGVPFASPMRFSISPSSRSIALPPGPMEACPSSTIPPRQGRQPDLFQQAKINLGQVFAGQIVGLRGIDDQIWLVSFLNCDLGFFDRENDRVEPATNPFAPEKV
ncbi:MAG TPA: hypothetical protein VFQ27_05695 [Xanthobacteraceae bacterium]|nr:hypothetical protein [Xanthobacteraceae bacterium]